VNAKRVNRLYREMGLQLRNKSPKRKLKAKLREGRSAPAGANDVWAMDFVHDQLYDGRKVRILTVIDAFRDTTSKRRRATIQSNPCAEA
jgi:putative transposase